MSHRNRKRGVLLDVDGVLLDSYSAFQTVWREWADGHSLEFAPVWAATHGRRPVDTILEVAPHLDAEEEYLWLQTRAKHPDLPFPPIQGARELLSSLHPESWALVTSSHEPAVRSRFTRAELPAPKWIVDASAVTNGKPHPQGYEMGASLLGVSPRECLVIEDAPSGITAGRSAGCFVVAVTTTHSANELDEAHQVVASLAEAKEFLDGWLA